MKAILILILALFLFGCGGGGSKNIPPPATDTTELHGQGAHVILKGTVQEIHGPAGKFVLLSGEGATLTVKVHPTVFLADGQEVSLDNLTEGQAVTVAGAQNPGIVKADTVWLEP